MGAVFSTANTWLHTPATLRSGYLLTWGILLGAGVWQSFVGGVVSYKTLPRHTFGYLQSKMFPVYFYSSALFSSGLVLCDLKLRPSIYKSLKVSPFSTLYTLASSSYFWQSTAGLALVTSGLHLVNAVYVGPKTSEVMFKRHKLEKLPIDKEVSDELLVLNKRFGTLHSLSTIVNLSALVTTGLIGWKIGQVGLGPKIPGGLGVM